MPNQEWGTIPNEERKLTPQELMELLASKSKAFGEEAGGRISNAYEDATQNTIGDELRGFAQGINSRSDGLIGRAQNVAEDLQRRGGRALDALGRPSEETPVGTAVRETREGLMDMVSPKPSMSERFGNLMDSARGTVSGMLEEKPTPNAQGRRVGDVWIEGDMMYRMTPEGIEYRRTQ